VTDHLPILTEKSEKSDGKVGEKRGACRKVPG